MASAATAPAGSSPSTPQQAKVTFDRIALLPAGTPGASKATSQEEPSSSLGVTDGDESASSEGDADSSSEAPSESLAEATTTPTSTRVRFVLTNHEQARVLTGRVCLVALLGEGPGEGGGSVLTLPAGMKLPAGPRSAPTGCPGGQLVRFSRLRPTEMILPVAPSRVRGLVLHFSEGPGNSHHSHAWTVPARATPARPSP